MNAQIIKGVNLYALGFLLNITGRFIGNRDMAVRGHGAQMRGRAQMIVGDAQRVIDICVKNRQRNALFRRT